MQITSRRKTIAFFIVLGGGLVALAVVLKVGLDHSELARRRHAVSGRDSQAQPVKRQLQEESAR